jgi:poly(A) polymerase
MRIRYSQNARGQLVPQAWLYSVNEHGITRDSIDPDTVKIIRRLQGAGFEAYIVGGAVRDLLLGRNPKDYDIATDAWPTQVRKLFRNSRVIGNRFRLVHIYFPDSKIIEVATFRAFNSDNENNVYGTIEEDVRRRDFTLNGLYYNPEKEEILDYVHGYRDIRKKVLRSILPLDKTFVEDPVRMIRAMKYSSSAGLKIPFILKRRILKDSPLLAKSSTSRMSEELFKILQSGYSAAIIDSFFRYRLLPWFLPEFHNHMKRDKKFKEHFLSSLRALDDLILSGEEKQKSRMLYYLLDPYLSLKNAFMDPKDKRLLFKEIITCSKSSLKPLIAPNAEIDEAVKLMFRRKKLNLPKKRSNRHQGSRFRGPSSPSDGKPAPQKAPD